MIKELIISKDCEDIHEPINIFFNSINHQSLYGAIINISDSLTVPCLVIGILMKKTIEFKKEGIILIIYLNDPLSMPNIKLFDRQEILYVDTPDI